MAFKKKGKLGIQIIYLISSICGWIGMKLFVLVCMHICIAIYTGLYVYTAAHIAVSNHES
jgi:hypothetical protein